eukprot:10045285-Lingulodinium_polyedra.AAC.1
MCATLVQTGPRAARTASASDAALRIWPNTAGRRRAGAGVGSEAYGDASCKLCVQGTARGR